MTGGPKIRFVVFAAPRTGSNLLCSLLNSHPDILCHHGLFNPDGIHYALDLRRTGMDLGSVADRDLNPKGFLQSVWVDRTGKRAIGFKMNRAENRYAELALLLDRQIKKIVLKRRNPVRTFVSEEIAKRTGLWETYETADDTPIPSIRVDPQELIRHIGLNAEYYACLETVLEATGQPWFEAHYESLAGHGGDLERMLLFLGVGRPVQLQAACSKRSPPDLKSVVANFDELAIALQGTILLNELLRADAPELRSFKLNR